jgi:uncharacterized membrane protein YheB (UPF0754 family)
MTFYPLEFTPSRLKFAQLEGQPFGLLGGWQGIIPSKAGKMAAILCDLMTTKLLDVKEMFGKIVPVEFAEALAPEMTPSMSRVVANVMAEEAPTFWNSMPPSVQAGLVKEAMAGAEDFLADVIEDLQNHVYEVLDLKAMVVRLALENKQDVVRMFQEVGESEFRIIEHSGFYFGFVFGIMQMITFYCVDVLAPAYSGPLLPVFGFMVGYATNWFALKLIFRPIYPTRVCCCTIQGAFLKRQDAVSEKFSALNVELFCNAKNLWEEMMFGRLRLEFGELVKRNTRKFTDLTIGKGVGAVKMVFGADAYARMRERIAQNLVDELPRCVPVSYDYQDVALEIESTVCKAMKGLPPDEFEGVLHPVFEEDEIKLIVVGGCLGALGGVRAVHPAVQRGNLANIRDTLLRLLGALTTILLCFGCDILPREIVDGRSLLATGMHSAAVPQCQLVSSRGGCTRTRSSARRHGEPSRVSAPRAVRASLARLRSGAGSMDPGA